MERELGFDELHYIFQITNLVPRGQFYLRAYNEMKFIVPKANVKYNQSWKVEWVIIEGAWGHFVHIRKLNTWSSPILL